MNKINPTAITLSSLKVISFFVLATFVFQFANADTYPKREMRSAWLATVWNLDWPKTDAGKAYQGTSSTHRDNQKTYLRNMIQKLKASGFNAVNFQVRSMCDAMYKSSYEPWSSALTGARGTAPYGNWDPLEYCIEVCHEFGMECHAWVNPFRFCTSSTLYNTTNDLTLRDNGWILTHVLVEEQNDGTTKTTYTSVLNPAIQEARNYIVENVCKEIVQNYDIDGMVWDDYFYPNGIPTTEDADDYSLYESYRSAGGTKSMGDWRRDNVNQTVLQAFEMIQSVKPYVKFGVAPAGVANVGAKAHGITPANITSQGYQYNGIFADPCAWILGGYIDYISPQLYWVTNHSSAPFNPLCEWWNNLANTYNIHCYVSHDIANSTTNWTNSQADYEERYDQVTYNRQTSTNYNPGEVYYSAGHINGPSSNGFGDYLSENLYNYRAIPPKIVRSDEEGKLVNPGKVSNLANKSNTLSWTEAAPMSINGYNLSDIPMRYAVYAIPSSIGVNDAKSTIHLTDGGFKSDYLLDLTYSNSFDVSSYPESSYWYAVTIVDRFGYEWEAATINAPSLGNLSLTLNSPTDKVENIALGDNTFSWTSDGTSFTFQISTSEDFTTPLIEEVVTTNSITISTENFTDGATYYWRVIASKKNYNSAWSEVRSFTMETRPTITITLLTPENTGTIDSETIQFSWEGVEEANYTLEIAEYSSFNNILISKTTTETHFEIPTSSLTGGKTYFWHIKASCDGYQSATSDYHSFITPEVEGELVDGISISKSWEYPINKDTYPELFSCVSPRTMAAYNGNVYILERAGETECSLLVFNGETGEYIKTISLPSNGDIYTSSVGSISGWAYQPGNCIFTDSTGNLYISCLTVTSESKPLTVCAVNVETGATTKIFEADLTSERYRIDYANAYGDLATAGGQIWAATTTDKVYRWTRNADGSWTEESTTISDFYPTSATALSTAPYIQPISETQFIVDGAATHPTLYTFNGGRTATLNGSFADKADIQPTIATYNGTCSITIGSTPLFVYVDNIHSFSVVANKHNFDFSQFQFMGSIPESKLGSTSHSWNLDQTVAINNADGSVTLFLYAPLNGLAAYRISLPEISITLDSPADNATMSEDFDFSWTGVDDATYTLEISTTESFDDVKFSKTTTENSYSSANFNFASETQYFWRVKASHKNYTSSTSEIRKFISPKKESSVADLSIEQLWNYSVNNNNFYSLLSDKKDTYYGPYHRSMTAYNGKVYVTYRESSTALHLLEFSGETGEYIRTIDLSGDCVSGSYGANGLFVDGANNLCVVSMGTSSSIPTTVCTVDISTGKTTQVFSYALSNLRIDYVNALGDVTVTGGQIWGAVSNAGSANHNYIYRWTRNSNGTWKTEYTIANKFYPSTETTSTPGIGGGPWVMPLSNDKFIVDGGTNYPTLYTFKASGNATYESGFDSNTALKPRTISAGGVNQITLGKYPLFIYSSENHEGEGFNFDIVHNPSSFNFADMEFIKTIPDGNLGDNRHSSVLNSIATIKNEDNSATIFVYAPLNGLAAYRISLPNAPISLTSPINGSATQQGFDFTWNSINGSTYTIEISSSESFENIEFSATTDANSYSSTNFSLANETKYYWRVKVANDNYTTTTSAAGQFISPQKPTMPAPLLFVPLNNNTISSDISFVAKKSYILDGENKLYTTKTTLEISKTPDFSEIFFEGYSNWKEESSQNSNYEIWLQYTVPITYFANGTYYWRVKAESIDPELEDGVSEVRQFTVEGQSEAPGQAETNYSPMHEDNHDYEIKTSGSNIYTLTNLWIRNTEKNDFKAYTTNSYHRGFCARHDNNGDQNGKDILWIAGRESNYSATAYLNKYDATSGEYLGRQTISTKDKGYATSIAACNDVFLDASNNLCVTNIAAENGTLQLLVINPSNGEITKRIEVTAPERIDHVNVYGDVLSGIAYVFAATSNSNVYRWELSDGSPVSDSYSSISVSDFYAYSNSSVSKFGATPRIYPISSERFYVDGSNTAFTLYDFSSKSIISSFASNPSCAPINEQGNGGTFFIHDSNSFIVYNSASFSKASLNNTEYKFNIAKVSDVSEWGSVNKLWTIPNESLGTFINEGSDYGTLASYLQYDALTGAPKNNTATYSNSGYDRTNIYIYVPDNGMAAYTLTRHIYTGAEDIDAISINININHNDITFDHNVENAQIYTLSGMLLNSIEDASSIEKPASKGVYILRLTINGITTTHKIVI